MGFDELIAKSGTEDDVFRTPLVESPEAPITDSLGKIIKSAHKRYSWFVDDLSFGVINFLHRRHPLPENFATLIDQYVQKWSGATLEEYYAVAPAAIERGLEDLVRSKGRRGLVTFATPLPSGLASNDRAVFDLYPSEQGWSAPTMIMAHGLMSVNDVGYQLWAKALNNRGWNAIFAHLPFHYGRCPAGRLSGELAIGPDIIRSVEGVRQSVQELRIVLQWLQGEGCSLMGAWWTSYGGWISGLLGCVDSRLQRMILLEPVLDLNHAIWHSHGTKSLRAGLKSRGVRPEALVEHMRLCCPSSMKPKMEAKNIILLAGEFDRITPVAEVARLHQHWRGSHFHVSPQGHVGHQMMPKSLQMAQDLWPRDFCAAPTRPSVFARAAARKVPK